MITHQQFYYVRHGQTDWNLNKKLQGSTDIPLNETGIAQAYEAKGKMTGEPVSAIYSSPLKRARKTADIINQALQCPIFEIEDLRACNFGPFEGSMNNGWLANWQVGDDSTTPDGVEPSHEFRDRARTAINQALSNPGPILIVAHGGVYKPVREMMPPTVLRALPTGQPIRHDPPNKPDEPWQVTSL